MEHRGGGDGAGLEAEALQHVDSLYGAALRLTRRAADAEDLVQDTYVKAVRFAHRFRPGTNVKAWLHTILHNTFLNQRRRTGRDPVSVDSEIVESSADRNPATAATPEDLMLRRTLDADLGQAIEALPSIFRQAVWLRDVEEFSYAEIAGMLDIPPGTVMSRISRGRRLLHDQLVHAGTEARPGLRVVRGAREGKGAAEG